MNFKIVTKVKHYSIDNTYIGYIQVSNEIGIMYSESAKVERLTAEDAMFDACRLKEDYIFQNGIQI